MTDWRKGKVPFLLEELQELLKNEDSFLLRDFEEVAQSFVSGYGRFVRSGVPSSTIGATLNLYAMFDMEDELPDLLRSLADKMENKDAPH